MADQGHVIWVCAVCGNSEKRGCRHKDHKEYEQITLSDWQDVKRILYPISKKKVYGGYERERAV
jgi:hypothetical protein